MPEIHQYYGEQRQLDIRRAEGLRDAARRGGPLTEDESAFMEATLLLEKGLDDASTGGIMGSIMRNVPSLRPFSGRARPGIGFSRSGRADFGRDHPYLVAVASMSGSGIRAALSFAGTIDPVHAHLFGAADAVIGSLQHGFENATNLNRSTYQAQYAEFRRLDAEKELQRAIRFADRKRAGESNFLAPASWTI